MIVAIALVIVGFILLPVIAAVLLGFSIGVFALIGVPLAVLIRFVRGSPPD